MKQFSPIVLGTIAVAMLMVSGWYFVPYFYRWSQGYTEQEAIAYLQHQIMSFRSLNFSTSSELIAMLKVYENELEKKQKIHNKELQFQDAKKRDALRIANKKMLQSYVKDLQGYTKIGMPTTSSVVQFSYDTVVRLTIALAELEKDRGNLPADEYIKRIDRMHEIIERSIIHGKRTLRSYLQAGLKEEDTKVQTMREHITKKVEHFIELNKILYL